MKQPTPQPKEPERYADTDLRAYKFKPRPVVSKTPPRDVSKGKR